MLRRNRSKATTLDDSRAEGLDNTGDSNEEQKQINDVGTCHEESPSCNPPDCETGKVDLKKSKKKKWYQNLLSRRDRLHPRKVEDHIPNLEDETGVNDEETEEDCINNTAPQSSRDSVSDTENGVEIDHTTSCKIKDRNFKTMEALGIYGLLAPAIAAVPATDEVNYA